MQVFQVEDVVSLSVTCDRCEELFFLGTRKWYGWDADLSAMVCRACHDEACDNAVVRPRRSESTGR